VAIFGISLLALFRKRSVRYLLLSIAFLFLTTSQIATFVEALFLSGNLLTIPFVDIHLSHLFDAVALLAFGLALFKNWDQQTVRRRIPNIE